MLRRMMNAEKDSANLVYRLFHTCPEEYINKEYTGEYTETQNPTRRSTLLCIDIHATTDEFNKYNCVLLYINIDYVLVLR